MPINQIEECIEFVDAGNLPFMVAQILSTAYNLVFYTGCFFGNCKKWNAQPDSKQTWENSKTHFLQAQNELQLQQQTAQTSGYVSANAAHAHLHKTTFSITGFWSL